MPRCSWTCLSLLIGLTLTPALTVCRAAEDSLSTAQKTAVADVQSLSSTIRDVNRAIWEFAEVGLEERQSSALLMKHLREAGFDVRAEVAGMPTAFVASYGTGHPIISILAEYDALPELSQTVSPLREPRVPDGAGHGCGHSGLGAGALGAALSIKTALQKHRIPGTIRLYGTPAEETTIGKVYLVLAGEFQDVDVCLHWHPASKNEVWNGGSKALVSAKFTFSGLASHASGNPDQGRSALDAVELMNVGVNFMREHCKEDARLHYVITNGGAAPNVVPSTATVWYYVRANSHTDVEQYFHWVQDIAKGAALMSQTKVTTQIDTDCHELIPNVPLAEAIQRNLERLPPPKFSPEEHAFARKLQEPLMEQFGKSFATALDDRVHPLPATTEVTRGSTDVGDISWHIPTSGLRTACFPTGSPGHCWQNVASIGSTVGEKGTIYAAQVLAATAIDLFEHSELITTAKADFRQRLSERKYTTLIPPTQKAPAKIR